MGKRREQVPSMANPLRCLTIAMAMLFAASVGLAQVAAEDALPFLLMQCA
jgi:hypothetical protein